jgi:hypothetical protein
MQRRGGGGGGGEKEEASIQDGSRHLCDALLFPCMLWAGGWLAAQGYNQRMGREYWFVDEEGTVVGRKGGRTISDSKKLQHQNKQISCSWMIFSPIFQILLCIFFSQLLYMGRERVRRRPHAASGDARDAARLNIPCGVIWLVSCNENTLGRIPLSPSGMNV